MNHLKTLSTATLISLSAGFAQAVPVTIYSEDFAGDGTATLIGTAEDTSGALWQGNTLFRANGSLDSTQSTDADVDRGPALLAVSLANDTQYIAEATMTNGGTNPLFFGFGEFLDPIRFHNQGGVQGWAYMLTDTSGQLVAEGPRLLGDEIADGANEVTGTAPVTLKIVLTTSSTETWTASFYVNDLVFTEDFALDSASTSRVNYIGFSVAASDGTQSLSSFTFSEVPEPGSLALLGLGGLMMARRRRDN